jgi:hypothetical protein
VDETLPAPTQGNNPEGDVCESEAVVFGDLNSLSELRINVKDKGFFMNNSDKWQVASILGASCE